MGGGSFKADDILPVALVLVEKGEDVHFKLKETLTAVDYAVSTDMFRLDDAGLVVIPALSNRDLVHISDGSDTGEIPSAVVKALLTRKEIVILEEGIEYKKICRNS